MCVCVCAVQNSVLCVSVVSRWKVNVCVVQNSVLCVSVVSRWKVNVCVVQTVYCVCQLWVDRS